MRIREERFAMKGTMNSPEIGEVDDGDVECVYHLRGSQRKPVYRENSAYFTVRLNHGEMIFSKMQNYMYEHGKINYLHYVDPDLFNQFLLDNAMKMLGYKERMRYIYRLEKKRLSEGSFWLVTDANFMNVVKWVGPIRVVDMYCLPIQTAVLKLPWDENVPIGCIVTDMKIGEILESVCVNNQDTEVGQKPVFIVEVFDDTVEDDDCYVVDEFEGDQLHESDGVDSRRDNVVDNVDVVEAQVGANDQLVEQIWETSTSDIRCSVENEAGVEVANDQSARFAEPSTIGNGTVDQSFAFEGASGVDDHGNMQFEGATGLGDDPVDTQFEQPTSEGATGLEDLGNAPVEPSVEEAINAQNTGTGSSGGESEVEEEDNDIGLEHFSDSKYEQEDVEEDNQGEDTFFRLSERVDIRLGNVSNEGPNKQNVNVNVVNSGSDYGDSDPKKYVKW